MKGTFGWSFAPYMPFLHETGEPYLCRLAPSATGFRCEWLWTGEGNFTVFLRRRNQGSFAPVYETRDTFAEITGLQENCEYECYVSCGEHQSRVRLIRTGEPVGTVVNYLHPEDRAYGFSGSALCSPSLLQLDDGSLLASMDVYESKAPQNLTLIFRSEDQGRSWHYVTELFPCFWGKLFLHQGYVYMLAVSTEYGDLLIGRSEDGGNTFGSPTVLLRGSSHFGYPGVHKNPQTMAVGLMELDMLQ